MYAMYADAPVSRPKSQEKWEVLKSLSLSLSLSLSIYIYIVYHVYYMFCKLFLGIRLLGATFRCGLVKLSGCHCTDAFGGRNASVQTL